MRIRNCKIFLETVIPASEVSLNDSRLVIDGQNFFYQKYQQSNLNDQFGCECDKYANFLREQLSVFQRANAKCYFVFKGGHESSESVMMQSSHPAQEPLLTREVYKQLLDEMGFDYTVCEYTVNKHCVALAQKLKCPILANNVEYFFRGVQYIPFTTLDYSTLRCRLFQLDSLMTKYNIDKKQVATFLALVDSNVFSTESLERLLKKLRLPSSFSKRFDSLLNWLARKGSNALTIISHVVARDEYVKLQSEIKSINDTIVYKQEPEGLPALYFLDKNRCRINKADPEWFAKAVVLKHIPIPYINIYKWKIVQGSYGEDDNDDSFLIAAPIVRYAFDLLTNFNTMELVLKSNRRGPQASERESDVEASIKITQSIQKPNWGSGNVFENGWNDIASFRLFEHFFSETLQISDWGRLERAPGNVRLLLISLVYLSRRRGDDLSGEVHAVLLCYVLLAAPQPGLGEVSRAITPDDRDTALKLLDKYFYTSDKRAESNRSTLHPLAQHQHCLRQVNFLNTLCGSPFPPTIYSKTYNATFVYNIVYNIKGKFGGDARSFLEHELQSVPTVLSFLYGIVDLYDEMK